MPMREIAVRKAAEERRKRAKAAMRRFFLMCRSLREGRNGFRVELYHAGAQPVQPFLEDFNAIAGFGGALIVGVFDQFVLAQRELVHLVLQRRDFGRRWAASAE